MLKTNNIIAKAALFFFAALVWTGCQTKMEGPYAQYKDVMIEVKVSAGGFTKAVPTASESTISSLDIYAYCHSRLVGKIKLGETQPGEPFLMDLNLPDGESNVEFFAIANLRSMRNENNVVSLPDNPTRDQIASLRYTALMSGVPMPMYAYDQCLIDVSESSPSTAPGHEGHLMLPETQAVEFVLSRSLAKLSVYAAKAQGTSIQPQILSVNLLAPGTRHFSYLFEQEESVLNAVASRANDREFLQSPVNITKEVARVAGVADDPTLFDQVFTGIYLPEVVDGLDKDDPNYSCARTSGYEREAVLEVAYKITPDQPSPKYGYVYLPKIVRNTHYKICILINAEGQIVVSYGVDWWDLAEETEREIDYPTHSYIRPEVPLTEEDLEEKPATPAQMSETKPFVGYFQMTYPQNEKWIPTLEGDYANHCDVAVYEEEGTVPVYTSGDSAIASSDKWYRIEVSPKPGEMPMEEEVKLSVTYIGGGFSIAEYLLVNGSGKEYFWPYSGTSVQNANYVIITMVN